MWILVYFWLLHFLLIGLTTFFIGSIFITTSQVITHIVVHGAIIFKLIGDNVIFSVIWESKGIAFSVYVSDSVCSFFIEFSSIICKFNDKFSFTIINIIIFSV